LHRLDLGNRDLIVAPHLNLGPKFPKILNQVVGKRIVVVENEYHGTILIAFYTWTRACCLLGLELSVDAAGSSDSPERATRLPNGGIDGTRCKRPF
jgi:hypothetical protein